MSKEKKNPVNSWISHAYPQDLNTNVIDPFREAVSLRLEEQHAGLTNHLIKCGLSREEGMRYASNVMMESLLHLQRTYDPKAQVSMVATLLGEEPLLAEFRDELIEAVRKSCLKQMKPRSVWKDRLKTVIAQAFGILVGVVIVKLVFDLIQYV